MRSVKLITLAFALSLLVSFATSWLPVRAQKKLIVGFMQTGSESAWRTAFTKSIRAEAQKQGINLRFSDSMAKPIAQDLQVRAFIVQKVDAILLAPLVQTGWDAVLKEAKDAKIPVILVDRGVKVADDSLYVTRVAADFNEEGHLAAAWLAQASDGICNIVEIQGTVGSSAALERMKGFNDVIALFPQMRIVATQSGDFTRDGGKKVMEGFIKSQNKLKDVCAVWSHNDDMLLGAIQAMKEAGIKSGKGGILTVSIDGVVDIFKAMADGDANASVELTPDLGPLAFQAVRDALAGKSVEKRIVVPSPMWFPDTAAEQYAKRSAGK